jgi:hypothetical protein
MFLLFVAYFELSKNTNNIFYFVHLIIIYTDNQSSSWNNFITAGLQTPTSTPRTTSTKGAE